ncbi:putative Bracovirus protein MdBV-19-2 [Microplitis demolitor]
MGNTLTYSYVIPRTWDENYTSDELIEIILNQLEPYTIEDQNFYSGPIITVAGVATILNVFNHRLCLWFALPGDLAPSKENYRFSPNFINIGQWANRDIIMYDDGDADTIIIDDDDDDHDDDFIFNHNQRRD